ncbi:GH32 C-terminal domain-containing protein [Anaerocellum diazotrophicum]|uniref:beta-fructofuranosidase n=1 Tax=Caldicellulosiruptor diazotrophicus TaxID=2806205 RepID=A0ABN6EBN4_9FIRM|nr:GH32 C-terminal domain-containing protein [Caldicellulosiruptor diazotrophicus]BCS82172.1 hypothetical protein CaldiYA01_21320 [Caldicellulosiruptor diazotrophicus]
MFKKYVSRSLVALILIVFVLNIVFSQAYVYANEGSQGETDYPYTIVNPGFETGDMTGWTVIEGGAFGPNSVSDETTWWAEQIPYNQEGKYHLNGWRYPESETGRVRSTTFKLGGVGWITFRLGGGKNVNLCYIQICDADTGEIIARYGNTEFADVNFPHIDQGMRLANMVKYRADLSAYIGRNLYIEIVDNATSDWGLVFADDFQTYYEEIPQDGVLAKNLYRPKKVYVLPNLDFEKGSLEGWTVKGDAFTGSVVNDVYTPSGTKFNQQRFYHVFGLAGANTVEEGNKRKGELISPVFTIYSPTISFLIGGTDDINNVYVALYDANNDKELRRATGTGKEEYTEIVWDVSDLKDKDVYIKVVDNSESGHINVDDFSINVTANSLINPGFETGDLEGWLNVEGETFLNSVTQISTYWGTRLFKQEGTYHLWGFASGGDQLTGVLESNKFILQGDPELYGSGRISFLIGGGNNIDSLYVALVDDSTGKEVFKATGRNDEQYFRVVWDASEYIGRKMFFRIVDKARGGFGHINADDFRINLYPFEIKNGDFHTLDLTGYEVLGNAFTVDEKGVSSIQNKEATGQLKSSVFELAGSGKIEFLVRGDSDIDSLYIALVNLEDGKEVIKATGNGKDTFSKIIWDVKEYLGKNMYIKIVDRSTSGYIGVDDIRAYIPPESLDAKMLISNNGFETGDFSGWLVTGDAFIVSDENIDGKEGKYFAKSELNKIGSIKSQSFKLGGNGEVSFLIGGKGNPNALYVDIYDNNNILLFRKTIEKETLERVKVNLSQYIGRELYIVVVDYDQNGYIKVDDFNVYNRGLIAYWSFDECKGKTAKDEVSKKQDYINYVFNNAVYASPKDPEWRKSGIKGGSLSFDGYSTFITRKAGDIELPRDQLTIEAWVAPRNYEYGDEGKLSAIVNQHNRDKKEGYILGMYRHGTWSFQCGIGDEWVEVWCNDHPLEKYKWNYIVATYDSRESIVRLYYNGQEVASKKTPKNYPINLTKEDFIIGKNNQAVAFAGVFNFNMFSGLIDEIKIYNVALSPEQIKNNFDNYIAQYGSKIPEIPPSDIEIDESKYDGDPHRPQYHAMPPGNWMNESHAPIYYKGKYHLFYQFNPQGPYWHQIHWGHWVSDDMVMWKNVSPALAPEAGNLDPDGCWSGSATYDRDGNPVIFYTAGNDAASPNQRIAIARPADLNDPDLVKWVKYPEPVIVQEKGIGIYGEFRDPFAWYDRESDKWYCLVGSGREDGSQGTALVYVSSDMYHWEYKGHLFDGDVSQYKYLGTVWELPVLLPIGKDKDGNMKYIFLVTPCRGEAKVDVYYWIGRWDKESCRFKPDHIEPRLLDLGGGHLTAQAGFVTPDGRTVLFSIVQNFRTPQAEYESGWAQSNALPVTVSYNVYTQDIDVKPIKELEGLRAQKLADIKDKSIDEANQLIGNIKSDMLEIILEFDKPQNAKKFGIKVRRSPRGEEETLFYYDLNEGAYYVDRNKSSIDPDTRCYGIQGGKVDLNGENVKIHIYIDRSIIESFINYKKKITTRVYPGRIDSLGIQLWADGKIRIKSLEIWQMNARNGEPAKPVYVPNNWDSPKFPYVAENWDSSKYPNVTLPPNHDFSAGNLSGWITEGSAFTDAHVTKEEKFWGTIYFNPSRRIPGGYHLWGFNEKLGGDKLTGTLRTQNFILGGNGKIDFLLSGGKDEEKLYAALVRVRDGKILFKQTGFNYEEYQRIRWDASSYIGEELYFILVDNSTADFGHLNLDDVHIPIKIAEQIPVTSQPAPITYEVTPTPSQQSTPSQQQSQQQPSQQPQQQQQQPVQQPSQTPQQQAQKDIVTVEINPMSKSTIEFDKNIKLEVPQDTIKGFAPQVKIAKVEKLDQDINVGTLIAQPIELSVEKGNIAGNVQLQIKLDAQVVKEDQVAIALIYDAQKGKWLPVATKQEQDKLIVTTNKAGKIAVVAANLEDVFKDVKKENWAYTTFKKAITTGLITGYEDMTLRPDKKVSLAEAAVLAQRAFEVAPKQEGSLPNVPQWASAAIKALIDNSIIETVKDSNAPLTRLDACVIIMKILEQRGINAESAQVAFADVSNLPADKIDYIAKAYSLGIVKGYNDNTFKPQKIITRSEMIVMLIRALEILKM